MLIQIHSLNPQPSRIAEVAKRLKEGGVVIYPTDTVYGLGCDITQSKAVELICRIKGIRPEKAQFSFVCSDLRHLSDYVKPIDTATYRILKKALPGPFTFIFTASNKVPRLVHTPKKTVGIRVPDHPIALALVNALGNPILSTSLPINPEHIEMQTDPSLMDEVYGKQVDFVIDGGFGDFIPSTVVDLTSDPIRIVRQGKGQLDAFL